MRKISLLIVLCLLVIIVPVPAQAAGPAAQSTYVLAVQLDYDASSLTVREQVRYHNLTGETLSSIVFQVTAATYPGAFDLGRAAVGDQPVEARLDGTVLEVPLPQALGSGGAATVTLDFTLDVPKQGDRLGAMSGVIALGNWFPILSVYRTARLTGNGQPPGWTRHQYVDHGDSFFTEVADYDVTITADEPISIAFPGTLVSREENRWHIRAEKVRDFALAISDRSETKSRTVDGTTISAFYLPGHERAGQEYLDAAANMVSWMNRAVTPYPYPSLVLAEIYGPSGYIIGQEYPGMIFVDQRVSRLGGSVESELTYLVNHEVAHMWFYGVMGDDQIHESWFDEGMATWFSLAYYRANHPDLFERLWRDRVTDDLDSSLEKLGVRPLNTGIYDYTDGGHYGLVVYRRAAVFIEELAQTVGLDTFLSALGRYASIAAFEVATSTSLLDFMQAQTETSLNPLYARYFSYPRYTVPEPPRVQLHAPERAAPGQIDLGLSPRPNARYRVFLDDLPVPYQEHLGGLVADISAVPAGDYLLTVLMSDPDRAAQDLVSRITVGNPPTSTPTPSEAPQAASPNESGSRSLPIPLPLFLAIDVVVLVVLGTGAFIFLRRPHRS